jgi:hypothetical protein
MEEHQLPEGLKRERKGPLNKSTGRGEQSRHVPGAKRYRIEGRVMSGHGEPDKLQHRLMSWRIFQRWGSTETFVGIVVARDRQGAIGKAVTEFGIRDLEQRRRLKAEARSE